MTLLMAPERHAELLHDIDRVHGRQPGWLAYALSRHHQSSMPCLVQGDTAQPEPEGNFAILEKEDLLTMSPLPIFGGFGLGFIISMAADSWTCLWVIWALTVLAWFVGPFLAQKAVRKRHLGVSKRLTLAIEQGQIVDVPDFVLRYWGRIATRHGIRQEQAFDEAFLDTYRSQFANVALRFRLGVHSSNAKHRRLLHRQITETFEKLALKYEDQRRAAIGPGQHVTDAYIELLLEQAPD